MFLRSFIKTGRPLGLKLWRSQECVLILSGNQQLVVPNNFKSTIAARQMDYNDGTNRANSFGFRKVEIDSIDEDEADDGLERKRVNRLSDSMTEELEKDIAGDSMGQKFILKQVLTEIHDLETRRNALPLPSSIDLVQWKQLISLTDRRARFHYLDSLMFGKMSFEEIQAVDDIMSKPIEVPEDLISKAVGDNSESRRRINLFLMHHELMRQDGEEVPFQMREIDLKQIAELFSVRGITKYISFMNITYGKRMAEVLRKRRSQFIESSEINKKVQSAADCNHIFYGLGHNAIHIRLSESTIKKHMDWQAMREYQIGNPLVVDFSYLSKLKSQQHVKKMIHNEATYAIQYNKTAITPFALHFTGVTSNIQESMERAFLMKLDKSNVPVEITDKHQLDLFPKDKLVYLSPDSRNDLFKYNEDDIYVIGGIIDKGDDRAPMTLANAKKLKIRHARFPMRRTIGLQADLNVETCVAIMNDMKASQVKQIIVCNWPRRLCVRHTRWRCNA